MKFDATWRVRVPESVRKHFSNLNNNERKGIVHVSRPPNSKSNCNPTRMRKTGLRPVTGRKTDERFEPEFVLLLVSLVRTIPTFRWYVDPR